MPEGSRLPHATSVWLTSQVQRCPNYQGVSAAEIRYSITPPRRDANFSLNARDARIGWTYPTARSGARPFVREWAKSPWTVASYQERWIALRTSKFYMGSSRTHCAWIAIGTRKF